MVGWVVGWLGGWGEIEIKAKLSPAEAGVWAELGKKILLAPMGVLTWSPELICLSNTAVSECLFVK